MERSMDRKEYADAIDNMLSKTSSKLNSKTYDISNFDDLNILKMEQPNFNINYEKEFKFAEVGVWSSNYDAWVNFLKTDKKYLLIFEDDVSLVSNFLEKINEFILEMPENWDALFFSIPEGNQLHYYKSQEHDIGLPNVCNLYQGNWLGAYMLNRSGAEKLIKDIELNIINDPIDLYMFYVQKTLNSYNLKPSTNNICNGYDLPTTIHNTNRMD